jgi:outer membrane protein
LRTFSGLLSPLSAVLCVTALAASAAAQPASQDAWILRAGAGLLVAPAYTGSNTYHVSAVPALRVAYGRRFFASVEEGIGYALLDRDGWQAGPLVRVAFSRDEDARGPFRIAGRRTNDLRGLGDVSTTAEAGGFVKYGTGAWNAAADLRHGIGGHDGVVGTLSLARTLRFTGPFVQDTPAFFSIGPRVTLAGADYVQTYFGVTPAQSAAGGLAVHAPGGGLLSYGVGATVVVPVARATALTMLVGAERLAGDAASSPLVRQRGSRMQGVFGLFVSRMFTLN